MAWGEAAQRLHARLALIEGEQASRLRATAHRQVLVVTGAAADLPWVEGVEYACIDPQAPGLWLPTSWAPDVPVDWLEQALATAFGRSPVLLWHAPKAAVPLDRLLPLNAALLQRIETCWAKP
ncbi:hypothetical protein PS3A_15020 [Pseudomonas sp. 3A(2025)]